MKSYRTYECVRNTGGGLDSTGCESEYIDAPSAQAAADYTAAKLASIEDCRGNIIIATDDDGDSAEAIIGG